VLVLPLVDAYRAGLDEKEALLGELDSAKSVAVGLEGFEVRVTEKLAQLKELEAKTVDDETLPQLRESLVNLAKETGCSVRRISPGGMSSRPWAPGDNPIGPAADDAKRADATTGFQLEWRPVSISLSGTSANLRTMLERVGASKMLMHAKLIDMYPSSPTRQSLTLDMELWYFTLARKG
jgi:hypothetical protein